MRGNRASESARLVRFGTHVDARGMLIVAEAGDTIPFEPKRVFMVKDVKPDVIRGNHSVSCDQLLCCVHGSVQVSVDDGLQTQHFTLDRAELALYLPRDNFSWEHGFTSDAVLLVLAAEHYVSVSYVSDRDAYRKAKTNALKATRAKLLMRGTDVCTAETIPLCDP